MDAGKNSGTQYQPVGVQKTSANSQHNFGDGNTDRRQSNASSVLNELPDAELMTVDSSQKNWKGIVVAILVISFICLLIMIAILATSDKEIVDSRKPVTLSDVTEFRKSVSNIQYKWIKNRLYFVSKNEALYQFDSQTRTTRKLFHKEDLDARVSISDFIVSPNGEFVAFSFDQKKEFRHSYFARYQIVKLDDVTLSSFVTTQPNLSQADKIQILVWSPLKSHFIFVKDNQIYLNRAPLSVQDSSIVHITQSLPKSENIRYGSCDWLYEEEVFKSSQAVWWSPDGNLLAFISFDLSNVSTLNLHIYGGPNSLYGLTKPLKYPKAGETRAQNNPRVQLYLYSLEEERIKQLALTEIPEDFYITFVKWYSESMVLVGVVDRGQIVQFMNLCRWTDGQCFLIYSETMLYGWTEWFKQNSVEPLMKPHSKQIFVLMDRLQPGGGDSFTNLVKLTINEPLSRNQKASIQNVIHIPHDINDVLHVDEKLGFALIMAAYPDVTEMHLIRVNLLSMEMVVLTNNFLPNCSYTAASLSIDGRRALIECRGPHPPSFHLAEIDAINSSLHLLRSLEDNELANRQFMDKKFAKITYFNVTIGNNITLNARMFVPPAFKLADNKLLPSILHVYGGPNRQLVTKKFDLDWSMYMASVYSTVVIQIDARGTENRGRRFRSALHRRVGEVEISDQQEAYLQILKDTPYLDEKLTGTFGWSYGGFVVSMLMGSKLSIPKCGIAVAPVTDFRHYDTAYSERYLGLYRDDPTPYERTNCSRNVENYRGKGFFLISGTGDDNVHVSNTFMLSSSLIQEGVVFKQMIYPDDNHQLAKYNSRNFLYREMTSFMRSCLRANQTYGLIPD